MATVKQLREITNMSQRDFAKRFSIPVRTLQEWEQGRSNPPVYVIEMLREIISSNLKQHSV